ncbi:response regulator transcription factor [Streptomyces sp. NPDC051183]|uniref:response regulator transcription factor n=1 Tax=Streptomyces sp. NPDC051183 TaxID=3155165 RepID=UPI0034406BD1
MIRVLLTDDEDIIRAGLRLVLGAAGDIEVVGEAASGAEAVEAAGRLEPDVVLLDFVMPGDLDGAQTARRLRALHPALGIVVLTTRTDEEAVARVWRAGADGYLLKTASGADMVRAVREAAQHRAVLSPDLLASVMDRFAGGGHTGDAVFTAGIADLSAQEVRTVLALADGLGNREIAELVGVAEGTVKTYVSRALHKFGLDNRTQLALLANDHRALLRTALGDGRS